MLPRLAPVQHMGACALRAGSPGLLHPRLPFLRSPEGGAIVNALTVALGVTGFFAFMAGLEQVALRFGWWDYSPPEEDET